MKDDYKEEFQPRLHRSLLYQTLKEKASEKDAAAIALIEDAVLYAHHRTKTIIRHMGEFTLHDSDHLFRVLHLMEKLLPPQTIKNLSTPELMLLILSSFFHDIGMAPDEEHILIWRRAWDIKPTFKDNIEEAIFNEFKRFCSARPEQQEIIESLIIQGKHSQADVLKSYLITEFIRQTHAERARLIIEKDWTNKITFRDTDLTVELAQICYSHNDDALSLLDLDKSFLCGEDIFACLPLVGVILRLSDILDFDAKRTPPILYSHLYVRHPLSLKEWSKHRAVEAWQISPESIQFSAKCNHPAIEAAIHEFCDMIDRELSICNNIISNLNEFNVQNGRDISVKIPFKVNRDKIRTQKTIQNKPIYLYRDTKFNLSKRQIIELLMGTKLYGNPQVALRELLQNSIDACLLRAAQEKHWGTLYEPEISVKYYNEGDDQVLEVDDNGTGMDQYIIDTYYSKVGSSFYSSTDFYNLKAESNADFTPTSRFGIGILSCFMVADTLIVDTKRVYAKHKSSDALNITVEGQESIFWIREGSRVLPGTTTKLILRKSRNPWEKMSEESFIKSVESVIPNPPFKIQIATESHSKTRDENSFKEITSVSLKDYSWNEHENIRIFELTIDKKELGIVGSATVAILEGKKEPKAKIDLNSRDVQIEGERYTLQRRIELSENSISETSKSITINDDGEISVSDTSNNLAKSKSKISLHGIEVPTSLFPEYWLRRNNQVKINWPFPLILVIDICGNRDLDLNSSRTEIILSDKWFNFEEELAYIVCSQICTSVSKNYWEKLKEIFLNMTKNEVFLRALERVIK